MAFTSAAGYGNLPNGNFSPVIYSKQVQLAFRKAAVCEAITNSDYFGEIAAMGDSVKIIKEPEITVTSYERGTAVAAQNLADAADKVGSQVMDASNVSFDNPSLAGAGNEPEVVAKISTLGQGQMTATPVKGTNGVFMVQVTAVNEPGDANVSSFKASLQSGYQSRVNNRQAIEALKDRSTIKDNRAKFF